MATQMEDQEYTFPDEVENKDEDKNESEGIEIEIEDDTPEEDRNKEPLPKSLKEELEKDGLEIENYDKEVKQKLKQMKKVWHDERREKEAALREQQAAIEYAKRLREENEKMRNILQTGEKAYIESINTAADLQLQMAEQAYKEAYESGDADKLVEANKVLQTANIRSMQAKNFKMPTLQSGENEVKTQPEQYQESVQAPQGDRKAQDWQKRNPWFGQKQGMTAYAYGVHAELRESGVVLGSDLYYKELDKAIQHRFPEEFNDEERVKPEVKKKISSVVAPATRSTGSQKVKLSVSELNLAKKFNLTPEQFAAEKLKLEKQNG
jgi:hypothetical protein